jgi:hypothetical protein
MRPFPRVLIVGSTAVLLVGSAARPAARQNPGTAPVVAPSGPVKAAALPPDAFAGTWDYNHRESVNAANGRPEQGTQSATNRRGAAGAPRPPAPQPGTGSGTFTGIGPSGRGGRSWGSPGGGGMPVPMLHTFLLRDLARDLLEVPESLTIRVAADSVTFTDDLDRTQTYPTNGRKQKYQIGAAVFDARTTWQNGQLKKQITAAEDFKMAETYFLSDDGQRLFVIIRLGEQRKDLPVVGVNRVYDRIQAQ